MSIEELEHAYQELEDSLSNASPDQESIARREFASMIAQKMKRDPDRADLHHKYGLCIYEIPNWTQDDVREIENAFLKAIECNRTPGPL